MFTVLDYSSALEYRIIRRYANIVYYKRSPNIDPCYDFSFRFHIIIFYILTSIC